MPLGFPASAQPTRPPTPLVRGNANSTPSIADKGWSRSRLIETRQLQFGKIPSDKPPEDATRCGADQAGPINSTQIAGHTDTSGPTTTSISALLAPKLKRYLYAVSIPLHKILIIYCETSLAPNKPRDTRRPRVS